MNQVNSRIVYLDYLRILACLLVIFTHAAMPAQESDGIYLSIISLIGSPSSELFLALSGAVLLPIKTDFSSFYKRRFSKLLPPLIIWSVVYSLRSYFKGDIGFSNVIEQVIKIPFTPTVGVYWFMYVMIGLYLFAPIISPWIKSATKKQLEVFLLIWGISLLMPYLNIFIPNIYNANGNYYWTLCNFSGFLGYWILGCYLLKHPIKIGFNFRWSLCLIGTLAYLFVLVILKLNNFEMGYYFDNLQIGSAFLVAIIFTIVQNLPLKQSNIVSNIANCSFGIYLIHIIILRHVVGPFFESCNINPILETSIITLISFVISLLIVKILSKLQFSKYIVGI